MNFLKKFLNDIENHYHYDLPAVRVDFDELKFFKVYFNKVKLIFENSRNKKEEAFKPLQFKLI